VASKKILRSEKYSATSFRLVYFLSNSKFPRIAQKSNKQSRIAVASEKVLGSENSATSFWLVCLPSSYEKLQICKKKQTRTAETSEKVLGSAKYPATSLLLLSVPRLMPLRRQLGGKRSTHQYKQGEG